MIPHVATTKHDPASGKYGNCFQASVASALDIEDVGSVPHFADDGVDGREAIARFGAWLSALNMSPIVICIDGSLSFREVLSSFDYVTVPYLVWGRTADGSHCVVCCRNELLHDTAIVRTPMIGGCDDWIVIFFGVKLNV